MSKREPMHNPPQFRPCEFRKSSYSEQGNADCVMVARAAYWVELRDSKSEFGAADDVRLIFTAEQFDAFLTEIRDGGGVMDQCIQVTMHDDDLNLLHSTVSQSAGRTLRFTNSELLAFYDGVHNGEFAEAAYTG